MKHIQILGKFETSNGLEVIDPIAIPRAYGRDSLLKRVSANWSFYANMAAVDKKLQPLEIVKDGKNIDCSCTFNNVGDATSSDGSPMIDIDAKPSDNEFTIIARGLTLYGFEFQVKE